MRRIKKAKIKYISLVERGANRLPVIYKSDDASLDIDMLVKAATNFDDDGELLAVVYAPELRDSHGDIADAAVIKDMMYDAAKDGVQIDVTHDLKALTKDQAFIAESFIVQKGDPRFAEMKDYDGNAVDVTGAWATVIKVDDPSLRQAYRNGDWNGVSMMGKGVVEVNKQDPMDRLVESLAKQLKQPTDGEIEMTDKELQAALAKSNETLLAGLGEVITKALKPEEKKKDEKPAPAEADLLKFEGEPTSENLRKHSVKVRRAAIVKAIDWTNAESIKKGEADIAALEAEVAEFEKASKKTEPAKDPEVAELEKQLAAAQKRSNQTTGDLTKGEETELEKEEREEMEAAKAMSNYANTQRGFAPVK